MRKLTNLPKLIIVMICFISSVSCSGNKKIKNTDNSTDTIEATTYYSNGVANSFNSESGMKLDSSAFPEFFRNFPMLRFNEKDIYALYKSYRFNYIWFDKRGIIEPANNLFNRLNNIQDEGISDTIPYLSILREKVEAFSNQDEQILPDIETELLLTSGYIDYVKKMSGLVDEATTKKIDWNLPRKKQAYGVLLDSLFKARDSNQVNRKIAVRQYYLLKDCLKKYRSLQVNGGWKPIPLDPKKKKLMPGDSSFIIPHIRERLVFTEDLKANNKSKVYDQELKDAINRYKIRNGNKGDGEITVSQINSLNISLEKRIEQILVNMERCRWIPVIPAGSNYIVVNIPEYRLHYIKDGKVFFESDVVVGTPMNKTVIFSGDMKYLVFSPYWNIPTSIIKKEIQPGMAKNSNYLEAHNMEWNGGKVRQKPGPRNSLGLVKFMFPNSHDIYLHDTPSKSLFGREDRAFSHGCIRVAKPKEFALAILSDDPNWNSDKITSAMNAGKEQNYTLKKSIPVYIAYLTAWVDNEGLLNFRKDVYKRDDRLASMILKK